MTLLFLPSFAARVGARRRRAVLPIRRIVCFFHSLPRSPGTSPAAARRLFYTGQVGSDPAIAEWRERKIVAKPAQAKTIVSAAAGLLR
jgi:hypothetical protein